MSAIGGQSGRDALALAGPSPVLNFLERNIRSPHPSAENDFHAPTHVRYRGHPRHDEETAAVN